MENNEDQTHHPRVETHTYPSLSATHSMNYLEDYWNGFVIGMSTTWPGSYVNTAASVTATGDAGTCLTG